MLSRFDSLDAGDPCSWVFEELTGEITAWRSDEVLPALREVERAVARGRHAAGFVAYEAAPAFDPALAAAEPVAGLPLLSFRLFAKKTRSTPLSGLPVDGAGKYELGPLTPSLSPDAYNERITRIAALIAAGDTYQVNLTFRLRGSFRGDPAAFYADLCRAQRSGYCALLPAGNFQLISASPELFFRWRNGVIETRPMKGTRPRGRWTEEDDALAAELLASPKDRAENLMIVDLLRNDLGRVAEFGSVKVPSLFRVERYPTVHQLTSTVTARPSPSVDLVDVFRALFPSGSVTGAPKFRASEIIRELEDSPRGAYTGAIGFISPDEAVFSVAIRTAMLEPETGRLEVGVGSGITADSDAQEEYRECLGKGAFLRYREEEFRLIESLRLELPGGYPLLDRHLARLAGSARYYSFPFDEVGVRAALTEAIAAAEALTRRSGEALPEGNPLIPATERLVPAVFKVRLRLDREGTVTVDVDPIAAQTPPSRIAFAAAAVDPADPFLYHKTTRRELFEQVLQLRPDVDDLLLLNLNGEVTETTRASLLAEIDGELVTPPLSCGLLAGVSRGKLLADGVITERILRREDLLRASRIWLVNAVRGRWEAELVE
ncbi:MAG: aminodeoxychorismate synthase component I [Gemmatimonadota bacterium]|jgi:para-aminobenzoate synthetase/4-amino-4-deoxychorismate lyase|nr:aminodeoxychorismate synthase component I [Gemmatimonadota bacterium]